MIAAYIGLIESGKDRQFEKIIFASSMWPGRLRRITFFYLPAIGDGIYALIYGLWGPGECLRKPGK